MYYLSREMHAQIQEIMWWVGGGGGGFFVCFHAARLYGTKITQCKFAISNIYFILTGRYYIFLILAGVFKFLWFEESFEKLKLPLRDGLVWSVGQNLLWTGAQVEMV